MAQRLLAANVELVAYNQTPEKLAPLREAGVAIAVHPAEAVAASDCVILMLTNAEAIENVLLQQLPANTWQDELSFKWERLLLPRAR